MSNKRRNTSNRNDVCIVAATTQSMKTDLTTENGSNCAVTCVRILLDDSTN